MELFRFLVLLRDKNIRITLMNNNGKSIESSTVYDLLEYEWLEQYLDRDIVDIIPTGNSSFNIKIKD